MKHRSIAVLFSVAAVAALTQAQITIVQDDVIGLKGSTRTFVTRSSSDYTGIAAIIAATGNGRTWDLTNRAYTFNDTTSTTYLDYSASYAGASSFSSSNLVERQINTTATSTTTNWSYYTISSTAMNFLGVHNISGTQATTTAYNTPVQAWKFPASFNTSWTTASSTTSQGVTSNVTFEYLVDGEGTVITPEGSFPCLRLKRKLTTTVFGFSTVSYVYTFLNKTRTFATISTDGNNAPNSLVYWSQSSGGQPGSPPSAPTLASPADGATGVSTSPTLSWNTATGASTYNLQVSTDQNFGSLVVNQTGISGISRQVTGLQANTLYYWRVAAVNAAGASAYSAARSFRTSPPSSVEKVSAIPSAFELAQNYPNPFNPSTSIQLSVASPGRVTLKVFDMLGHTVASIVDEYLTPGIYRITWDANQLPSGHYLYRATSNGLVQTKRMTLLK